MIELGNKARDIITGFSGIVTGKATYLSGCDQVCLAPESKQDGSYHDSQWFDEGRIRLVSKGISAESVRAGKPGGPNADTPRGR